MTKSRAAIIKNLKPGESVEFNIEVMNPVKTLASNLNTIAGKKLYITSIDRQNRIIKVTAIIQQENDITAP